MKKYILFATLFIVTISNAQLKLKPGFDKWECMEMLRIAQLQALPQLKWNDKRPVPLPEKFSFVYRSPLIGLQNMWDLWVSKDSIAVISIRGTDIEPNPVSWLVNMYAAMVPAKGELKLEHAFNFNYNLCDDPKAAVHVGFLVATAYLSRDIVPKIDSCYKAGIKNFIIAGHSQGGAITYLLTSHLENLKESRVIPADIRFKTYSSAAPKAGNLYYAYAYETLTRNWAFNAVNTSDWVPEVPLSVQTANDFTDVNPFKGAKAMIKKQKFPNRMVLRHMYNRMSKPSFKAQKNYEKYLGKMVSKLIKKELPEFELPIYFKSSDYVRIGTTVVLYADDEYKKVFSQHPDEVWLNHFIDRYLYLADKLK